MSFSKPNDFALQALIEALSPAPKKDSLSALSGLFSTPPPTQNSYLDLLAALDPKPPVAPTNLFDLGALLAEPKPASFGGFFAPFPDLAPSKKRKVFFSFHFDDVMRVNNVRKAFEFQQPNKLVPSFYDSSLWESRKLDGDDALKRLIREGVENTSVVCVLAGTQTWSRRWVRYEIARSVVDKKGLLAVSINGLNHHRDRVTHAHGPNPLAQMAVGKMQDGTYRLFEWKNGAWCRYGDYTASVPLPTFLSNSGTGPAVGHLTSLNYGTIYYDFAQQNGPKNIGGWIDLAAAMVGR